MKILVLLFVFALVGCGKYQTASSEASGGDSMPSVSIPTSTVDPSTWVGVTGLSTTALQAKLTGSTYVTSCLPGDGVTVMSEAIAMSFSGSTANWYVWQYSQANCTGATTLTFGTKLNLSFGSTDVNLGADGGYEIDMVADAISGWGPYQIIKVSSDGQYMTIGCPDLTNDASAPNKRPVAWCAFSYVKE